MGPDLEQHRHFLNPILKPARPKNNGKMDFVRAGRNYYRGLRKNPVSKKAWFRFLDRKPRIWGYIPPGKMGKRGPRGSQKKIFLGGHQQREPRNPGTRTPEHRNPGTVTRGPTSGDGPGPPEPDP